MKFSQKKFLKKLKQQRKTNPGNKETYNQPVRPRSVKFDDKTKYNRKRQKQLIRKDFD